MSLRDYMRRYADSGALRLHTPGHKGSVDPLDITELTDGSFPAPQLEAAEKSAARIYGVRHASYLCGGSSQGVKSAIYCAGCEGVADINSHRSVFDGFKLAKKKCITAGARGSVAPLTVKDIKKALSPKTGAVVLTSPTYFGYAADVAAVREFCDRNGLILIVDGAHGAHFGFSDRLPAAFAKYAHMCNLSVHKTLSALTGSALLLDNLDDNKKLRECVGIMGTTSPSYLLYSSIELALEKAESFTTASAYGKLYDALEKVRGDAPFLKNDDFTRLVLDCEKLNISPDKLNAAMIRRGVYGELITDKYAVFLFSAENTPADAERFAAALKDSIQEITLWG